MSEFDRSSLIALERLDIVVLFSRESTPNPGSKCEEEETVRFVLPRSKLVFSECCEVGIVSHRDWYACLFFDELSKWDVFPAFKTSLFVFSEIRCPENDSFFCIDMSRYGNSNTFWCYFILCRLSDNVGNGLNSLVHSLLCIRRCLSSCIM